MLSPAPGSVVENETVKEVERVVLQDVAVPVEKIVTQEKAIEVQKVLTPPPRARPGVDYGAWRLPKTLNGFDRCMRQVVITEVPVYVDKLVVNEVVKEVERVVIKEPEVNEPIQFEKKRAQRSAGLVYKRSLTRTCLIAKA